MAPEEPRLAKKLLPAYGLLLEGTSATSFAYEILNSMIKSGLIKQANQPLISLCIEKLKEFIVDRDANRMISIYLYFNIYIYIYNL